MSLKYEIALINVFWNEEGTDTRYFNSVEEQTTYFESKAIGRYSNLSNFNMKDNIDTSVIYRLPENTTLDIYELVASNYAIIRRKNDDDTYTYRYFYAYCKQDSSSQVIVNISLDDIQTNYFTNKNNISTCKIERACLDRFVEVDTNTVKFNGGVDSPLFESEGFENMAKRLVDREELKFNIDTNNDSPLNTYLNNNVKYWVYIYVDAPKKYRQLDDPDNTPTKDVSIYSYGDLQGSYGVLCYPIFKQSYATHAIYYTDAFSGTIDYRYNITSNGLYYFRELNNQASYFYSMKISLIPPFKTKAYTQNVDYKITGNELFIKAPKSSAIPTYLLDDVHFPEGLIICHETSSRIETSKYILPYELSFNKSDIKGNKNTKFNPKLNSVNFKELNIVDSVGNTFGYDIQKVNLSSFNVSYNEVLSPDITRYYARINLPNNDGIFIEDTEVNFTGLVGSNDNSIPYSNGQLASMLANNKNFYLQTMTNANAQMTKSTISATSGALGGLLGGNGGLSSLLGFGSSIANAGIDYALTLDNARFTVDNMRNAPSQLVNASGNVLFQQSVNKPGIYIERYECLPHELNIANDYMFMYGFTYNKLGDIKDFDNIRKYFNYVQADINVINAPLSIEEKRRLQTRFKNGVRFWNSDTIQYTLENYERSLD